MHQAAPAITHRYLCVTVHASVTPANTLTTTKITRDTLALGAPGTEKSIYDVERAKFEGSEAYKLPVEEIVHKVMEVKNKDYPNIDNY
jgi:hypothetical protein